MHLEWTLSHSSLVGVLYCHRLTSASVFCLDCVYLQIYTHKNKTQKMFKSTVEYYKRKCNPLSTQTPISGRLAQNARKRTMDMDMDMDRSWSAEPEAIRAMPLAEEGGHQMEGRWMGCGSVSESAICTKRLLVQLLAEQRAEDASGARSDAAVARTLKADGDGAGHSGGLLHEALAAAHAARHTTWECQAEIRKRCLGCGYWSFLS